MLSLNSLLSGHLVYQGDSIEVEKNAVHFQIYQYGFGKVGPVSTDETFAEDGSYSAILFDGDYKIIIPNGDGPFMWKQTASGDSGFSISYCEGKPDAGPGSNSLLPDKNPTNHCSG